MVTNNWFTDLYCPDTDSDEGGNKYILGGYTRNRNTPTELMGAVQLEDGSFKLFWIKYDTSQPPSSISFHETHMRWQLPENDQEALYEILFGGEPGWEWDLIREILNDTFFRDVPSTLKELQSSTSSWDEVKKRLVQVGEFLAGEL